MNYFTTEIFKLLVSNSNCNEAFDSVVSELFRQQLENSINEILDLELTAFLDYDYYARSDNPDSRNGSYFRTLQTKFGALRIKVPRDRLSQFYPAILPRNRQSTDTLIAKVQELYRLGFSNQDITQVMNDMYGVRYSKAAVSEMSKKFQTNIDAFKNRPLSKEYAVIYLDATFMSLRRDTVAKEAVHIAIGITPEGNKEILAYSIAPNESIETWKEILGHLKNRGVERVSLFCTDGLHGMPEAIHSTFGEAKIQRCLLHVSRNIASKVRVSDRSEILTDFKKVYSAREKEEAEKQLIAFKTTWKKKYPKVVESMDRNEYMLTFYDYPESVRSSLYTTNMIESYNKQLKRKFKTKEQFPNESSMEKYLVNQFEQYNEKNMSRIHRGFGKTSLTDWFGNDG